MVGPLLRIEYEMKDRRLDRLTRIRKEYHRNHPWRLNKDGLMIPHCYSAVLPNALSWWADVGFILNDRRVIVWWQHPRIIYEDTIREMASEFASRDTQAEYGISRKKSNYRRIRKFGKKNGCNVLEPLSEEQTKFSEKKEAVYNKLQIAGIDLDVFASWKRIGLDWATAVSLVVPMKVNNEVHVAQIALLARKLLLGQTTLKIEFPNYSYGKKEWLEEQCARTYEIQYTGKR